MDLTKPVPQHPLAEFVPVRGVVHLMTSLGVFLDIESRRIFVGALCMLQMPDRIVGPGEPVTLHVSRSYAKQEGLVS
jgi:hypothetical protein